MPNDPSYVDQWGWDAIQAPAAWDLETGDPSIVVNVIDTGIDTDHPDLVGNIWTNAIALQRQDDGDMAELKIKPGPPASKHGATLLCKSRIEPGNRILRTLSSLLG